MSKIYVDEIAGIASADTVAIPGHVIQVVQFSYATENSISTSTLTATPYTATLTPASASSKILITWSSPLRVNDAGQTDGRARLHIYKNGSDLVMMNRFFLADMDGGHNQFAYSYLDSPATTSPVTYTIYGAAENAVNIIFNDTAATGTLILQEIAG